MAKSAKKETNGKSPQPESKIKLFELTALKNIDSKESKDKTAIWIKNWHLSYEIELRKLQVELMKLQKTMKSRGTRILYIFEYQPEIYPLPRLKQYLQVRVQQHRSH